MAYTKSLAQLRQSLLVLGQYENSADITASVANQYINDALEESYNIIVTRWDDYYTVASSAMTVNAGVSSYTLPDDFYKLRKVEMLVSGAATDAGARWARLYPVEVEDAHTLRNDRYPRYRLVLGTVSLFPPTVSGRTLRVYYIPAAPQLELDTDTIQFDTPIEQKLVLHIALRDCYQRQDLPTQELEVKIQMLASQLRTAGDHDAGEPFYLTRRTGGADPYEDDY